MNSISTNPESATTAVDFDPFAGGELLLTAPPTESQTEIWTSVQMGDEANCAYNESQSLKLRGQLDIEAFKSALQELVQRHEALRTTFSPDGSALCIAAALEIDIPFVDLSNLKQEERDSQVAQFRQQAVEQPFDLEHGPLFRAQIIKLQPQEHLVILTAHHIICDGWSWAVLMPDLGKLYGALRQGILPDLEEVEAFSEYAIEQAQEANSQETRETEEYWLKEFSSSVPILDFPTDRPRPPLRTFDSAREDWELSQDLVTSLKQLGKDMGCSFMTTILAGFEVFTSRLTGQEDVVVGISAAGQAASGHYNLVGHCVNLLPLRSQINPQQSFSDYLRSRRATVLDALDNQQFTFGSLVKKLAMPRDSSRIPLVPVTFNIDQALDSSSLPFDGLEVEFFSNPRSFENFELFVNATEFAGKMTLECQYNTNLFEADTIRTRMAELETLLRGIVANPDESIAQLPILSETEQQLMAQWNQTQVTYPQDKFIHQLFEEQVERTPDSVAVVFESQKLTYRELDRQAERLAHYLRNLGVKSEELVAICLERSPEMLVALLAVLKAGGAYVPLDPNYPKERLAFMLGDAQVSVLITNSPFLDQLSPEDTPVVCLDRDSEAIAQTETSKLATQITPDNLAYLIYTSGSTGQPKGVQVPHKTVVNFLHSMQEKPGLTQDDILLSVTTLSFDIAVLELLLPLTVGATTVLISRQAAMDGEILLKTLNHSKATAMQATPATWRLLVAAGWQGSPNLKILSGGEALPPGLAQELLKRVPKIWNMYGPTETTIWSTCYEINEPAEKILIGQPIANTQIYLLDAHQQRVPVGVPGEMYIGGAGVVRGYLNRPDLTAERFIPDPFNQDSQARLYKTGDLARYQPDGNLEYIQRIDNQVKVRGFRIELGEIEATMAQHSGVKETVVVVREDIPDEKTLVGYFVPETSIESEPEQESASNSQSVEVWQQKWDLLYESGLERAIQEESPQLELLSDAAILAQLTDRDDFAEQVQEWLNQSLERIATLKPKRVMEIGCGTGQILLEIAPQCTYYLGTDYAALALQALEKQLQTPQYNLPQVTLACQAADEFQGIEPDSFDTVIIHSVAQYFPDYQYLLKVVENSVQALQAGGCLYIGDVQSYALLEAYHGDAQLKHSSLSTSTERVKSIVEKRVRNEDELVIDPDFFHALKSHIPGIERVETKLRRGNFWNETTQFHYDVFIYVGNEKTTEINPTWHDWLDENLTVGEIRRILEQEQPDYYCIKGIPNARIQKEVHALTLLQDETITTVADLQTALEKLPSGVDPEDIWELGDSLPYQVELRWTDAAKEGYFEVVFIKLSQLENQALVISSQIANPLLPKVLSNYANSPMLKQAGNSEQIKQLRLFLKEKLPDYMVPSTFVSLDTIPLTPNGKVDRKALPKPDTLRLDQDNYIAPETKLEQQIAEIWSEVLNVERLGIHDNFFELGGHSLLAIKVISRLRQTLQIELPLSTLFEMPTVTDLAGRIETIQWAVQASKPSETDTMDDYEEGEL